ncbi:MAG: fibronectin type III domain-containing protein, partial [Hominilimicola sp.]
KVAAVNASDPNGGEACDSVTAIPAQEPEAPSVSGLESRNAGVFIGEINNTDNNGDKVTSYIVYYRLKGKTEFNRLTELQAVNESIKNTVVEGLENGNKYEIAVSAVNGIGEGAMSEPSEVTVGLPAAVKNLEIVPQTGQMLNISFDEADGRGSDITGYDLYIGGTREGVECVVEKINITDTSYQYNAGERLNGDKITVYVVAKNAVGESKPSETAVSIVGAPSAPVLTKYEADENGVSLAWTASTPNGNALKYYTVYVIDEDGNVTKINTPNASTLEMYVGGESYPYTFVPGKKYSIRVTCTNSAGEGMYSNTGTVVFASPAYPENITGETGDGTLTVSWTKPENNGGYEITGYNIYLNNETQPTATITWSENEGVYQLLMNDHRNNKGEVEYGSGQDNLDAFSVVITGLANGYAYTADVTAINEMGEGPKGSIDEPETPKTKASAPVGLSASATSGTEVQLSWKKPMSDGGSSITGYVITSYKTAKKNYETLEYEEITRTAANTYTVNTETKLTVTGLESGYAYEFEVAAVTAAGNGEAAVSETVMTHTKPSAPIINELESGVGDAASLPLTVRWSAPEDDGNSPIIGYDIYINKDYKMNLDGMISADKTEYVINDSRLKRGTRYSVTVIAYNAVTGTAKSNGVVSDSESIMLGTVPAPKDIQLTGRRDGTINVTWSMEQYENMLSYIDRYVIYINDEYITTSDTNNVDLYFRPLGEPQKVQVSVISIFSQEGNKSLPKTITIGAPDKVTNVAATAGKESASVTWNAVNTEAIDTDIAVTRYTVYADGKEAAAVSNGGSPIEESTSMQADISGLEGGREYKITVTASNQYGESVVSDSVMITPWSKPGYPTVKDITSGVGSFSFTFDKPDGNGAEITGYKVYVDGSEVTAQFDGTKATVTGVADGVKHEFCITAVNAQGLESDKPDSFCYVTTGVPEAPENVKVLAGVGSATVTFDKSADIEGYPVTGYEVMQNGTIVKTTDADTTSVTIDGLEDGKKYAFTVRAVNAFGAGEESGEATVIPGTPLAPVIESVSPQSEKLTVKWTVPQENAGRITKYAVYVNGVEAQTTPQTETVLDELENGSVYTVTVSAYNYVGEGEVSAPVMATPGGAPGVVTNVTSEPTYTDADGCGIVLRWNEPDDNGGISINEYKVQGEGNINVDSVNKIATITGLNMASVYQYEITAVSAAGEGEAYTTEKITTLSVPEAPKLIGANSYNNSIYVTWSAPGKNGGTEIIEYKVYAEPTDGSETITWVGMPTADENGEFNAVITDGLVTSLKYNITVTAINIVGESESSSSIRTQVVGDVVQTVPGAPINVQANAGDGKVTLTWSAPHNDGNSTIKEYHIWAGNSADDIGYIGKVDGYTFTYTDEPLKNGVERFYKIKAINDISADGGNFCEVVSATPVEITPPTAPTWPAFDNENGISAYEVNAQGTQMTIQWNKSTGDEKGGNILYEVYVNGELKDIVTDTVCVLSDLKEGIRYNIQIKAVNEIGGSTLSEYIRAYKNLNIRKGSADEGFTYDESYSEGIYANIDADYNGEEDAQIEYTVPSAPENVKITKQANKATVTWDAPLNDGNKTIEKYYVYINGQRNEVDVIQVFASDTESSEYSYNFDIEYGEPYAVYVKAYNSIGEGDPTQIVYINPVPDAPYELSGEVTDTTDINLTWKISDNDVSAYVLYVNGAAEEVSADNTINTDGTVEYTYHGEINKAYNFSVSAIYESVESGLSNTITVSTNEDKISKPLNVSVTKENEGVTVTWDAPENAAQTDIAYYAIYVNGEMVLQTEADETSITLDITESCIIKIAGVCKHEITGEMSDPYKYSTYSGEDFGPDTPGAPVNLNYNLDRPDGILAAQDNLTITWETAAVNSEHEVAAESFNVYSGGTSLGNVTSNEFRWTVVPGKDYNISIEPVYGDKVGPRSSIAVEVPANEYPAPAEPALNAQLNEDNTNITLTWTSEEDVKYYLTVNGTEIMNDVTSPYNCTVEDGVTNYIFKLKAVKTYSDGGEGISESEPVTVSIGSSTYLSNPPVITGTLSYGTQTKVFWTAPAEKQENETGEIEKYTVVIDGVESEAILAGDTLVYTIDFSSLTETKEVKINAYKTVNGNQFCSAESDVWIVTPNCNIVSSDDFNDNNTAGDIKNPDTTGDGKADVEEKTIKIPIKANTSDFIGDIVDKFGNVLKSITPTTNSDGNDELVLPVDSNITEDMTFDIVIRKEGYTTYTITGVPYAELGNVNIENAILYVGDLNGDGTVNTSDAQILSVNMNKKDASIKQGDLNGDGTVNTSDAQIQSVNMNKKSSTLKWAN